MSRTATALFYVVLVEGTREFVAIFSAREHAEKFAETRSVSGSSHGVEEAVVDAVDPFGEKPLLIPMQPSAAWVPHVFPENPTIIEAATADPPLNT